MTVPPYYDYNNIIIYNHDCLQVMKQFRNNQFNLIFTSPPYNMRTRIRNGQYTTREKSEHLSKKYQYFSDDLSIEDYYEFHKQAISEMIRIADTTLLNFQLVTGSKEAWLKLMGDFSKHIKDIIVWDKGHGEPAIHSNILNSCYELILVIESTPTAGRLLSHAKFNRGTLNNIWRIKKNKSNNKSHKATFPYKVIQTAIDNWKPNNILDPFMGTGTTIITAQNNNIQATGIDIAKEYCNITINQLNQLPI